MGVIIPQVVTSGRATGAQVIDGSLKFDRNFGQSLSRTPSSAGNRRTWTWSGWVKRTEFGGVTDTIMDVATGSNESPLNFNEGTADQASLYEYDSSYTWRIKTTQLFRDTGWYHLVWAVDTTQSTSTDRVKFYVNGRQVTDFSVATYPSQNHETFWNSANEHKIGQKKLNNNSPYDGHLSNVYLIDGQALGPEYFGFTDPLTNTWKPKKYTGSTNDTTYPNDINTNFSSNLSASSGFNASYPANNAFDGNLESFASSAGGSQYLELSSSFSGVTSLRIQCAAGSGFDIESETYTISGTGITSKDITTNGEAKSLTSISLTSTTISGIRVTSSSGLQARIVAIEINGIILKDNAGWGLNGFHLPFDGSAPIGQDQSGNGNDWTPVNFGGSVELDSPQVSGAKPILNTLPGGTQAGVGVFGSKQNVGYAVTVYNDGGGNKYYIDGVKQDTVTGLIRGATYTFDTSDSTVSSHPFRFSATSNGSHGGGSEYTNGVAAITGAATTITVPHDAPNTLYYYCTSHSGMGADITGITTNEKLADQYASNCVFALPILNSKEDVSASIACTMSNASITNSGVDFVNSYSNFYNGSGDFTGASSDALYTGDEDTKFKMEEGDFTVECWVYSTSSSGTQNVCQIYGNSGSKYYGIYWNGSSLRYYVTGTGGPGDVSAGDIVFGKNRWYHLALVRNGSTLKGYADGVEVASGSITSDIDETGYQAYVGRHSPANNGFTGYIQDFRVYKGVAKYTSDFVVPSTSPNILPDTPSGVSGGSKLAKITEGAVTFDGSGDYLATYSSSSDFTFGTGDFTIEMFLYNRETGGKGFIQFSDTSGGLKNTSTGVVTIHKDGTTQKFRAYAKNTSTEFSTVVPLKQWCHVALVRDSGTVKLFVNGKQDATTISSDTTNYATTYVAIGGYYDTNYLSDCIISNVRVNKGTALYTKNFTPPTAPLTNVTNTKLLCCQSNVTSGAAAASPNISGINDGTVWSSTVTGPTRVEDRVANAFNGSTSGPGAIPAYPGTLTFAPGFTGLTTVKIYGYYAGSGVTLHVNGSQQSPSSGAFTLTISTSTLDSVVWTATNGFNYMRIDAIEVDSTVLVDPISGVDDSSEAATNFNPFITDINTVRGQETGYVTWNPLDKGSGVTLSDGNLNASVNGGTNNSGVRGTMVMPKSGKYFFAIDMNVIDDSADTFAGLMYMRQNNTVRDLDAGGTRLIVRGTGTIYNDSTTTAVVAFSAGDQLGVAVDCDANSVQFYRNSFIHGAAQTPSVSITGDWAPWCGTSSGTSVFAINTGQRPFKFPPPDGFSPLNTANTRPVKVISRPDQYVGIITYVGAGATKTFTGLNFGDVPDFVWMKNRDRASYGDGTSAHNYLYDTVRGTGTGKMLTSSTNEAEGSKSTEADLDGFVRDGFRLDAASGTDCINNSGDNFVAWCWKAGGNKNTFNVDDVGYASAAAAGLDGGSINPSGASVGTKQGFSIIKFASGSSGVKTLSHGLLEAPTFALVKTTGATSDWSVYHIDIGGVNNYLVLNGNNQNATATEIWGSSLWTSSVFGINSGTTTATNQDCIAYLWHDVPGLQKFGSFRGNNLTDGAFIELGFRPSLVWIKRTGNTGHWFIIDNKRTKTYNPVDEYSFADITNVYNPSNGGPSGGIADFLSNGIKLRENNAGANEDDSYIYCAWAEAPTVDSYGGGANAR